MDASTDYAHARPTLLGLPVEARLLIYSHLVKHTGIISVFGHYTMAENVNQQTMALLHVCRLMRSEVQDSFYQNQAFEFRSHLAIKNFCKAVKPYHTSIIKNIAIGTFLCRRGIDAFKEEVCKSIEKNFTGIETLTINDPNSAFISVSPDEICYEIGFKLEALRTQVSALNPMKLYRWSSASKHVKKEGISYERWKSLEKLMLAAEGAEIPQSFETQHPAWETAEEYEWRWEGCIERPKLRFTYELIE